MIIILWGMTSSLFDSNKKPNQILKINQYQENKWLFLLTILLMAFLFQRIQHHWAPNKEYKQRGVQTEWLTKYFILV